MAAQPTPTGADVEAARVLGADAVEPQLAYPLWDRDPLRSTAARLLAADVAALAPVAGFGAAARRAPLALPRGFGAGAGRVVGPVAVCGVCVEAKQHAKFLSVEIDDGTGCVPVVVFEPDPSAGMGAAQEYGRALKAAKLGATLRCSGRPSAWRGRVQIITDALCDVTAQGAAVETLWWVDCLRLRRDVYERSAAECMPPR